MAYMQRRLFSTTIFRMVNRKLYESAKPSIATPAPTTRVAILNTPELLELAERAKGPWKGISNEDTQKLYRATFSMTFKEMNANEGHYKIVIPSVTFLFALAILISYILKETVGPKPPHTFNNPEWAAKALEINLKNNANPIQGISSKYAKKQSQ